MAKSLLKFHEIILKCTKTEVLFDSEIMTISSLALKVFLKIGDYKNILGVEPVTGYNAGKTLKNQSKIGIEWLNEINDKVSDSTKFRWIYHALGEKKIDNFYVDGYDESEDTIYEFLGCFYHGCSDCYDLNLYNKKCQKTFARLNSETSNRLNYLKLRCRKLIIMKECEYLAFIKGRPKKIFHKTPLKIRDSLYGGCTSPAVLYKDCFHQGKIDYIDFISLYPSVQFEFFPIENPIITVDEDFAKDFLQRQIEKECEERLCGFIKCTVLPPSNLYFPVLPVQIDDKLLFPLCFECAKLKDHGSFCTHSSNEKCFTGTWCLHEIYYALEKDYKIVEIFELIY